MFSWFSKPDNSKDEQRKIERELRKANRDLERDRRELERCEKRLELEIRKLAKEGNHDGCKVLAKQLLQLRKQKNRSYTASSKLHGVAAQGKAMEANAKLAGVMNTAGRTMANMNRLMQPEQVAASAQAFSKEITKMDMTDELVNDALDDILNESEDEEEAQQIIGKVLDEIGIEISGAVAGAPAPDRNAIGTAQKPKITDEEIEAQLSKLRA